MEIKKAPQDNSSTYQGHNKLLYGVTENGDYATVQSTGWEVETIVTSMAVEEMDRLTAEALARLRAGQTSALEYFMAKARMDIPMLSQATGLFQWRIHRHFRPAVFVRLKPSLLQRYAEVLGVDVDTLRGFTGQETVD